MLACGDDTEGMCPDVRVLKLGLGSALRVLRSQVALEICARTGSDPACDAGTIGPAVCGHLGILELRGLRTLLAKAAKGWWKTSRQQLQS